MIGQSYQNFDPNMGSNEPIATSQLALIDFHHLYKFATGVNGIGAEGRNINIDSVLFVDPNITESRRIINLISSIKSATYVTPIREIFDNLSMLLDGQEGRRVIEATCADVGGLTARFVNANASRNGLSILKIDRYFRLYPEIITDSCFDSRTRTLDEVLRSDLGNSQFDLVIVQARGADLMLLRGAVATLRRAKVIYVVIGSIPNSDKGHIVNSLLNFLSFIGYNLRWMIVDEESKGQMLFTKQFTQSGLLDVRDNIAVDAIACQSSLSEFSLPEDASGALRPVPGVRFGFHTQLEQNPWWQVEFDEIKNIAEIHIFNRVDVPERAKNLQVLLSNDGEKWDLVHDQGGIVFGDDGHALILKLNNLKARLVKLMLNEKNYFHLQKVEIFS